MFLRCLSWSCRPSAGLSKLRVFRTVDDGSRFRVFLVGSNGDSWTARRQDDVYPTLGHSVVALASGQLTYLGYASGHSFLASGPFLRSTSLLPQRAISTSSLWRETGLRGLSWSEKSRLSVGLRGLSWSETKHSRKAGTPSPAGDRPKERRAPSLGLEGTNPRTGRRFF